MIYTSQAYDIHRACLPGYEIDGFHMFPPYEPSFYFIGGYGPSAFEFHTIGGFPLRESSGTIGARWFGLPHQKRWHI